MGYIGEEEEIKRVELEPFPEKAPLEEPVPEAVPAAEPEAVPA